MTLAIGYEPNCGVIVIQGNGVFPARSLVASLSATLPNTIAIKDLGGRGEQTVVWGDLTSLDGSFSPASMADALAYLNGEFAKSSPVGEAFGSPAVAAVNLAKGQPVAVSRVSGQLFPARADTYVLGFVAGLASADTGQGFTNQPAHGAVTLADWTGQTGTSSLSVGQPYFLGRTGGLTSIPDFTATCVARVGVAAAPFTLIVDPTDPILL